MSTPILPFAVWASGTTQASIPANDNSLRNEILNGLVISMSTTAQPGAPTTGDIYIIPTGATGAQWSTFDADDLAIFSAGTWYAFAPVEGVVVNVAGILRRYTGAAWASAETAAAEIVTATKVIAATEMQGQGGVFYLNSATEFQSTLPAPALGLRGIFFVAAAPVGTSYTIVTASSSNVIVGHVLTSDVNSGTDADVETGGADTITFVASKAVVGDWVELFSDGTKWYARGACSVFDAITITTAS